MLRSERAAPSQVQIGLLSWMKHRESARGCEHCRLSKKESFWRNLPRCIDTVCLDTVAPHEQVTTSSGYSENGSNSRRELRMIRLHLFSHFNVWRDSLIDPFRFVIDISSYTVDRHFALVTCVQQLVAYKLRNEWVLVRRKDFHPESISFCPTGHLWRYKFRRYFCHSFQSVVWLNTFPFKIYRYVILSASTLQLSHRWIQISVIAKKFISGNKAFQFTSHDSDALVWHWQSKLWIEKRICTNPRTFSFWGNQSKFTKQSMLKLNECNGYISID